MEFCTACGLRNEECRCSTVNQKQPYSPKYDIAKSTTFQIGTPGPRGPSGPGSMLFYAMDEFVPIPPEADDLVLIEVEVTTTEDNQRVKLDATLTTDIQIETDATSFEYSYVYVLRRDPPDDSIAETFVSGSYTHPDDGGVVSYIEHPNLTIVDIPGPAGTYTYRVEANEFDRDNLFSVSARHIGITAQVFPPTNS